MQAAEGDVGALAPVVVGQAIGAQRGGDVDLDHDQVGLVVEVEPLDVLVLELATSSSVEIAGQRGEAEGREERVLDRPEERAHRLGEGGQDHLHLHRALFRRRPPGPGPRPCGCAGRPAPPGRCSAIAEVDLAVGDVQADRGPEQQGPGVRVAVGLLVRRRRLARREVVVAGSGRPRAPSARGRPRSPGAAAARSRSRPRRRSCAGSAP